MVLPLPPGGADISRSISIAKNPGGDFKSSLSPFPRKEFGKSGPHAAARIPRNRVRAATNLSLARLGNGNNGSGEGHFMRKTQPSDRPPLPGREVVACSQPRAKGVVVQAIAAQRIRRQGCLRPPQR